LLDEARARREIRNSNESKPLAFPIAPIRHDSYLLDLRNDWSDDELEVALRQRFGNSTDKHLHLADAP